jgi:hypothetical protein
MSDFDPAETIVNADELAQALEIPPAQIVELTRLGILRPVERDDVLSIRHHRYEFLESLRAFLRHYRTSINKEN